MRNLSAEPILDEDDTLYVITLARPYIGLGSEEVNEWLETELPS